MPGTFDGRLAFASIRFPAPGAPEFRTQSGDFASVAVVGSVTRITFQAPIAPYQGFPSLTLRSATGGYVSVVDWTSTYLDVETLDTTGAAAEIDFDLTIVAQTVAFVVPPAPPPLPPPPTANLIGHWDASALVGLSNGDPITVWNDLSPQGNDLVTTKGGTEWPLYIASDPNLNGQPAASFVGFKSIWKYTDNLSVPGMPGGNAAVTTYTVAYGPAQSGFYIWYWGGRYFGDPGRIVSAKIESSDVIVPDNLNRRWGGLASTAGSPFVAAWAHTAGDDVANSPLYLDGTTGPSVLASIPGPLNMTATPTATGVYFGVTDVNGGPVDNFSGVIAEVLVYNDTHTPATIAQVTAYLKNKWGIP
jgi:hypothetical protein